MNVKQPSLVDGVVHTLEWHVESFIVGDGKRVLQNIAGKTTTGELTAIMGPSGAGKTTLLECISLRNRDFEGAVHYDDKAPTGGFFTSSALVHQKELLFGFMTPYEYLIFHGIARMSHQHSREEICERVNEILREVKLEKCAQTIIGGADPIYMKKGISGGERKRLAIATELILAPRVIFLDEPSSGLDSVMAESIFDTLHNLSSKGRIIMASVHSPSSDVFHLFSHLLLLTSNGQLAYHGHSNKAIDYFARLGYFCPDHYNPADFFLKTVTETSSSFSSPSSVVEGGGKGKTSSTGGGEDLRHDEKEGGKEDQALRVENLQIAYMRSSLCVKSPLSPDQEHKLYQDVHGRNTSAFTLFKINLWRNLIKVKRDKVSSILWAVVNIVIGLLFGVLYWQQGHTWRNFMGGIFSVLVATMFMCSLGPITNFPMEWAIFVREYYCGANAVVPYMIAKFLAEARLTYGPVILCTLVYWMMGLEADFTQYILFVVIFVSFTFACISLGLLVSSFSSNPLLGLTILPLFISPMIMFSGVLCQSSEMPTWLSWLQHLSLPSYSFSAILKQQSHILGPVNAIILTSFVDVNEYSLGTNVGILWAFYIGYQLLAYLILSARLRKAEGM